MDEIIYPNLPNTNYILNPPNTIFYPPVAEIPYLDPVLLPRSGTGRVGTSGRSGSEFFRR